MFKIARLTNGAKGLIVSNRRNLSIYQPCFQLKKELLADERLQQLVAELERPLNLRSVSIDDSQQHLLDSIEKYRPKHNVVPNKQLDKLIFNLSHSYTVKQLNEYIKAHNIPGKGVKKQQLMERIIRGYWGIKSTEEAHVEEMEYRKNKITEQLPATIQELFFIIGNNGDRMKEIEEHCHVHITIDVENSMYILEGTPQNVLSAKKEIKSNLNLSTEHVNLPKKLTENASLFNQFDDSLINLSKISNSFIALKDDKIQITSLSAEKLDNAKRLISLLLTDLDVTEKPSLNHVNKTFICDTTEYTVLPMHDSKSMSLFDKHIDWNRLKYQNIDGENRYKLVGGEETITLEDLKDQLITADNVSLEAKFGFLLFENSNKQDYYKLESTKITELFKNRNIFFPTNPPYQMTPSFIPLTIENGFHQRVVQLEYINKSLLINNESDDKEVDRLQVELLVNKDGTMQLKNWVKEKNRFTVDLLGVHGNVDIRLIAKHIIDNQHQDTMDFTSNCKLLSYNEVNAPTEYNNMLLSDVTFLSKKSYMLDNHLITINHIEQQEQKAKRTEMNVNSMFHPNSWSSFSNLLNKIANQWNYTRD